MGVIRRVGRPAAWLAVVLCLLLPAVLVAGPDASAQPTDHRGPRHHHGQHHHGQVKHKHRHLGIAPVMAHHGFADPSVTPFHGRFVAVSTGRLAPRMMGRTAEGPWWQLGHALARKPSWAATSRIWAADVIRADGRWLMYFSAPVFGLGPEGRCIGVAKAKSPLGHFEPIGNRPLVCPTNGLTPPAFDLTGSTGLTPGGSGVIDPSGFRDKDGQRYLLYRTQALPATIRMLRLDHTGMGKGEHGTSIEVVRSPHVVENPALVRHRGKLVLFTSEGNYGSCHYQTHWRRAGSMSALLGAQSHLLFKRSTTGVCGPGGADLVYDHGGTTTVFFNGWTCRDRTCPPSLKAARDRKLRPERSMYAARMQWTHAAKPRIIRFLH